MRYFSWIFALAIAFSTFSAHALKLRMGQRFRISDAQRFGAPFQQNDVVELVSARLIDADDGSQRTELGFRLYLGKRDTSKLQDIDHSAAGVYTITVDNALGTAELPGLSAF